MPLTLDDVYQKGWNRVEPNDRFISDDMEIPIYVEIRNTHIFYCPVTWAMGRYFSYAEMKKLYPKKWKQYLKRKIKNL